MDNLPVHSMKLWTARPRAGCAGCPPATSPLTLVDTIPKAGSGDTVCPGWPQGTPPAAKGGDIWIWLTYLSKIC